MALSQLPLFMDALSGQESSDNPYAENEQSGAYGQWQIMPSNWGPWAKEAGLGYNAPQTPENQRKVAAHKMSQYYRQFGSWAAVAVAWFAGPDRARRFVEGDRSVLSLSDGNMTVGGYIEKMQQGMKALAGRTELDADPGIPDGGPNDINEPVENDDDASLFELFGAVSNQIAASGDPWGEDESGLGAFFNDMGQRAEDFKASYELGTASAPEQGAAPPPPGTYVGTEGTVEEDTAAGPDGEKWTAGEVLQWGQSVAEAFGVSITSHRRSEEHNEEVGGAPNSDHLWGGGIDFAAEGRDAEIRLYRWLKQFEGKGAIRLVLDEGDHIHVSFVRGSSGTAPMPGGGGGGRVAA